MPLQQGTRTTFNDTVGLKVDLSDMLPLLVTPHDTPMFNRFKPKPPKVKAVKHEWSQDTLPASSDTLGGGYTAGGGTITVTDYTLFKAGYAIKIDSEIMRVTTTPTSSTVTVTTAYAGTTNANHSNGATVEIIGYAVTDGADPAAFATTNKALKYNFHQVFQEAITVSDLNQWTESYGVKDKWTYEVEKWLKVLAIRAEKSVIYGERFEDTTNSTRLMGGLLYYITTNKTNVGGAVSETNLKDEMEQVYNAGGVVDLIVAPPKQVRKISELLTTSMRVYNEPGRGETIGVSVTKFVSDFGEVSILMDRHIPSDTIFLLDSSKIRIVQGQPFTLETLARTGTARKGQIVGWFTLEVAAENHHSIMTGLT